MLKFSLSQEDLEKALEEDLLLQHLERDRWFFFPVHSTAAVSLPATQEKSRRIDWSQWPRCGSRDA